MADTTPQAWPHIAAVLDLLAPVGLPIHVGEAPGQPTPVPYWLLIAHPGDLDAVNLAGVTDTIRLRLQVRSIGSTTREAVAAADAARGALIDARPAVTGRACWPLQHVDALPVMPDPDLTLPASGRRLHMVVDTFLIASTPGSST